MTKIRNIQQQITVLTTQFNCAATIEHPWRARFKITVVRFLRRFSSVNHLMSILKKNSVLFVYERGRGEGGKDFQLITYLLHTHMCLPLGLCLFGSMPACRQLSFYWMNLFSSSVCNFTVNIVSWNLCINRMERCCMD